MNIDFLKIAEFCTTKRQIRYIEKLKKKFSIKSRADLDKLHDLVESFLANEKFDALELIFPELLKYQFEGNFNLWNGIQHMVGIMNEIPNLSKEHEADLFHLLNSVTEYQSPKMLTNPANYLNNILSQVFVNDDIESVEEAVKDGKVEYEYFMRQYLISQASVVKLANQSKDKELEEKMNKIISEQLQSLKEPRLLKYS